MWILLCAPPHHAGWQQDSSGEAAPWRAPNAGIAAAAGCADCTASRKPQAASNYEENARRVKYFLPNFHFFYPVLSTPRRRSIESAQQVYQKEFLLSCALTHKNAENRQISKNFSAYCGRCYIPYMGLAVAATKKSTFFQKSAKKELSRQGIRQEPQKISFEPD